MRSLSNYPDASNYSCTQMCTDYVCMMMYDQCLKTFKSVRAIVFFTHNLLLDTHINTTEIGYHKHSFDVNTRVSVLVTN